MNNLKPLYIIIGILIVLNITTVFMLWRKGRPQPPNPGRVMERHLDLSEDQKSKIKNLSKSHHSNIRDIRHELLLARKDLFDYLESGNTDSLEISEKTTNIGELHAKLEKQNYWHMHNIRDILSPEQRVKFRELMHGQRRRMERQHR